MPQITDQEALLRDNVLVFVSKGPKDGMWRCQYLKCPVCKYYVFKGAGYDECTCGNISVDSHALRVTVSRTPEADVETYNARTKERSEGPRRTSPRRK